MGWWISLFVNNESKQPVFIFLGKATINLSDAFLIFARKYSGFKVKRL